MVVMVTGASGLLGRAITRSYLAQGAPVHAVGRRIDKLQDMYSEGVVPFVWDPAEEAFPEAALDGVSTIFHLMGEPMGGRWTKAKKARIVTSRVTSAQKLGQAINGAPIRLISASSFAIYPGRRGEVYTEETKSEGKGMTFIQATLKAWENAALATAGGETKVNIIRFGLVCSPEGYPKKLARLFQRVGGVIVGDGEQMVPIVDLSDAVKMMRWAAEGGTGEGVVNCVSPTLPRFRDVATTIADVVKAKIRLTIPNWLARPVLGGSADYFLLSYDMRPERALSQGFRFSHQEPEEILARALAPYAT